MYGPRRPPSLARWIVIYLPMLTLGLLEDLASCSREPLPDYWTQIVPNYKTKQTLRGPISVSAFIFRHSHLKKHSQSLRAATNWQTRREVTTDVGKDAHRVATRTFGSADDAACCSILGGHVHRGGLSQDSALTFVNRSRAALHWSELASAPQAR
jgi:hypothetical protein